MIKLIVLLSAFTNVVLGAEIEKLEVRGSKEHRSFLEHIDSVSVLGEGELPTTGRENDLEILNGIANLQVNTYENSFSLRGINSTGVTGYQKDNLASLLIDGLFQTELAMASGSFNLWDMERIEVFRGAQSTTQGINSLAGSIQLFHEKPQFENRGAARLTVGNLSHREGGVVVNTPLSRKVTIRVALEGESNGGYITNQTIGDDEWGGRTRQRAHGRLLYEINEDQKMDFDFKYNKNRQGGNYSQSSDPFSFEVFEDQGFLTSTENHQMSNLYTVHIADSWSNEVFLGYSKSRQFHHSDADGGATNVAGLRTEFRGDHFATLENRLYFSSPSFENMLGLHIHDFQLDENYDFNLLFPLGAGQSTLVNVGQDVKRTRKVYSILDSMTYRWNENHSLQLGVRGEISESLYGTTVFGQRLLDLGAGINAAVDNYVNQVSGEYQGFQSSFVFLPKIAYSIGVENHRWGASYTKGYRTAGVSINRQRASTVEYAPEYTDNYELSYKFVTDSFQITSNLFYISWKDQQVQIQLSNNFYDTQVENAAESSMIGGELETRFSITGKHQMNFGLGYTQTKFEDFQTLSTNYGGNEFPYAPQWTGRLSHIFNVTERFSWLTVFRYLEKSYNNAENSREGETQFYINMNATYRLRQWSFQAYMNNILDSRFLIYDGRPTSSTSTYQANYFQTSTPREFGVQVRYDW